MRREGVSVKYIMRSSGLQPIPLEIVKPRSIAVARAIHGAGPEAAGTVRLAVVEALIAERQSGNVEPSQLGSRLIEGGEAAAEREQESAALAQRETAWRLGQGPVLDVARCRLKPPQRGAGDVDPPQLLLARTPQRALAEHVLAIDDARRLNRRHAPSGFGYDGSVEWPPRPAWRARSRAGSAN